MIDNFDLKLFNQQTFEFLKSNLDDNFLFKLTPNSDTSIYSHCFGIFILNNLDRLEEYDYLFDDWYDYIINELKKDDFDQNFKFNKAKMQKLCFALSALYLLNNLDSNFLNKRILKIIDCDFKFFLSKIGFYTDQSQSGNLSMCFGILLTYSNKYLKKSNKKDVNYFSDLMLDNIDKNGFFNSGKFSHLSFQNFYHQFEFFEYLNIKTPNIEQGIKKLKKLNSKRFRNAPYIGSSGCYDFDAISLIISSNSIDPKFCQRAFNYIYDDRNSDYGFSESKQIRPLNFQYFYRSIFHIITSPNIYILRERVVYFLGYSRSKFNKLDTHWTNYSRKWNESNLWDTWLKTQILYKLIFITKHPKKNDIKFINFPGMGFFKNL